jgi:hypothetical protein
MGLRVTGSVVKKTPCEGKVGENWIRRLSLAGERPLHGLANKGGPAPEKPLD